MTDIRWWDERGELSGSRITLPLGREDIIGEALSATARSATDLAVDFAIPLYIENAMLSNNVDVTTRCKVAYGFDAEIYNDGGMLYADFNLDLQQVWADVVDFAGVQIYDFETIE